MPALILQSYGFIVSHICDSFFVQEGGEHFGLKYSTLNRYVLRDSRLLKFSVPEKMQQTPRMFVNSFRDEVQVRLPAIFDNDARKRFLSPGLVTHGKEEIDRTASFLFNFKLYCYPSR